MMHPDFAADPHPGKPRILFIGYPESSHTHSWIDLLDGTEFNVRFFALPSTAPPAAWKKKTYLTAPLPRGYEGATRQRVYPPRPPLGWIYQAWNVLGRNRGWHVPRAMQIERALARVIRDWQPDIIHTLGFDPAAFLLKRTRDQYGLHGQGCWVAQTRGRQELSLHLHLPGRLEQAQGVLGACDWLIADNALNYSSAVDLGLAAEKCAPLGPVPGTGGMDIDSFAEVRRTLPSRRERSIVWPKTYEMASSKALPVLEALKLAWDRIKPCRIEMCWVVQPEIEMWFRELPAEIRAASTLHPRLPRDEVLAMMGRARVVLAPSLTDGVPNSMLEAMALGALPLVSPLETIVPLVCEPDNVLFAHNLYPQQLAAALTTAMTDDGLVDRAAVSNVEVVRRLADRAAIRPRVVEFYRRLAAARSTSSGKAG